jgi:Transposase IS200 like
MAAASDRFRSAGVPPAFDLMANVGKAIWGSRGYLPHVEAPNLVQHIVFRLADSLPAQIAKDIARAGRAERVLAIDAALDRGYGRRDLARSSVATLVETALLTFSGDRYALIAWCVMPNHVHVLLAIKPGFTLDRIVHSWKSYTAKEINEFWGVPGHVGRRNTSTGSCAMIGISLVPPPISRVIRSRPVCTRALPIGGFPQRGRAGAGGTPAVPNYIAPRCGTEDGSAA